MCAGVLRERAQDRERLVGVFSSRWMEVTLGGSDGKYTNSESNKERSTEYIFEWNRVTRKSV